MSYLGIITPREVIIIPKHYNFQNGHRAILDVSGEKKKENAIALIITRAIILKQLFSSGSANIVE